MELLLEDGSRTKGGVGLVSILCRFLACLSFLQGCTGATQETIVRETSQERMERLSVLTYNTLHGLEVGRFSARQGELEGERAARLALQIENMAKVAPDLMLLQEVNPLPDAALAYVDGLKQSGLDYTGVHQVDACGIRLSSNLAVMPDLNNGIVVLAKAPFRIRKLAGVKLSGGIGGCDDNRGVQFGELRYAVIAEIEDSVTRKKFLAVSLHLHSGIERDEFFMQRLIVAQLQGRLPKEGEYQQLLAALAVDQQRRIEELRTLVRELQILQAKEHYAGVLIGGDFNFEPDSPEYRALHDAGLKDTYVLAGKPGELNSYDPKRNPIARNAEIELPPALNSIIRTMPEEDRQKIVEGYQRGLSMARRIDFIFVMLSESPNPRGCLRQELFGQPGPVLLDVGSDHFGVLTTYTTEGGPC